MKRIYLTMSEVLDLQENYGGVCLACEHFNVGNVEPDAEGYECEHCGQKKVMGIEEALIRDLVKIDSMQG